MSLQALLDCDALAILIVFGDKNARSRLVQRRIRGVALQALLHLAAVLDSQIEERGVLHQNDEERQETVHDDVNNVPKVEKGLRLVARVCSMRRLLDWKICDVVGSACKISCTIFIRIACNGHIGIVDV